MSRDTRKTRVLAVCSAGGHWVQLSRLLPALEGSDLAIATVDTAPARATSAHRCYRIPDATRWDRFALVRLALRLLWIVLKERPDCVLSTGAAPGYFGLRFAKLVGARTLWLDSIANVERVSMAGVRVRPYADVWLTQWEHLAASDGPRYFGKVL
jgi:hypothetical protein